MMIGDLDLHHSNWKLVYQPCKMFMPILIFYAYCVFGLRAPVCDRWTDRWARRL